MTFDEELDDQLQNAERDFKTTIKLMNFFLNIGKIVNDDKPFETKVEYKQRIVFSTMDKLLHGQWRIPSDWDDLSLEEKNHRLNQTIKSVID